MATLQTVVDRITLDYLNRPEFNAATIRAVQAAIRHYERQRWPWNQASTSIATTVANEGLAVPSDFLVLDLISLRTNGSIFPLTPRSFEEIRVMNATDGITGIPHSYALRGTNFILSPHADSAYEVVVHYIKQLPKLTAGAMTGTNDWLSAAEDVIVYHATKLMWANVLRNTDEALKYGQLEAAAVASLTRYRDQNTSIRLQPNSL